MGVVLTSSRRSLETDVPRRFYVETGDYRANRQHWVTVTRIAEYPRIARVVARTEQGLIVVETERALALALDLRDAPIEGGDVTLTVDGHEVYRGSKAALGHVAHLHRTSGEWELGFPAASERSKRPGVSGPLTDAYRGRMVHVVGTQNPEHTADLRRAAERAARGWPLWLWHVRQEVVEDTAVTPDLMQRAHLVLYGTHGDNSVLEQLEADLPVEVAEDAIVLGSRRFEGSDVGIRTIYPNPRAPERYVVVQAGVSPHAVLRGNNLPDFLPDYVVYDDRTTSRRQRLATGSGRPLALGYFDDAWQLPEETETDTNVEGGDPSTHASFVESNLPVPPAPHRPPRPTRFRAPPNDPAGVIAREIARRVPSFHNYRAEAPGATWRVDPRAKWSIRGETECHTALEEAGILFRPVHGHPTPIPSPVELLGSVQGVWFRMMHEDRTVVISCELAAKLPRVVSILRRHGVRGVDIMSAYRSEPTPSFHTMGLALDIGRLWTDRGWLNILNDFEMTPDEETCDATPGTRRGRVLRDITCDLARSSVFQTVITPNYNEGHRNHWHFDARPDDPRLFLR